MKKVLAFVFLAVSVTSFSQCYHCANYDVSNKRTLSPGKAFKSSFSGVKKVKWYKCDEGVKSGVRTYSDSTVSYIYSKEGIFLGKETRSYVTVVKSIAQGKKQKVTLIQCPGPNILPRAIWPAAEKIFNVDSLAILNEVDGSKYWVCDIFKLEIPETHLIAKKEGTTTFYILNMDNVFSIFKANGELDYPIEFEPETFFLYPEEL